MLDKTVSSTKKEKAYQEQRLASFLEDCKRMEGGHEPVEAQLPVLPKSPLPNREEQQPQPFAKSRDPQLQHFGYVALPGEASEVKHLRIEVILEPTKEGAKKGDTFLLDLDLEVQKKD